MRPAVHSRIRREIAVEAARLIQQDGLEDYLRAKRKAAGRLGVNNRGLFPSNREIETALINYQALFRGPEHASNLAKMRHTALRAMRLLKRYQPCLVGPVLSGTAGPHSEILLHLYADAPEPVALFLAEQGIPSRIIERRLKIEKQKPARFSALKFMAGDMNIALIILPPACKNTAPIDPISNRAMRRASLAKVERLAGR